MKLKSNDLLQNQYTCSCTFQILQFYINTYFEITQSSFCAPQISKKVFTYVSRKSWDISGYTMKYAQHWCHNETSHLTISN